MDVQVGNQGLKAGNKVVMHALLISIEPAGDTLLLRCQIATEPTVVDLRQRLTLDLMFQTRVLRMILSADATPEYGVLRLRVEDHTVEIKKGCLERSLLHFSDFWVQN